MNLGEYWSRARRSDAGWVHPDDKELLCKRPHTFNLDFPPPAFVGDIENAKIVILVANGGYDPKLTPLEFAQIGSVERYMSRISAPTSANWRDVAPYYGGVNYAEWIFSGDAVAVNACAYRSPKISQEPDNRKLIELLPSVAMNRRWLLETIWPLAWNGQRLIIGKRHALWDVPSDRMDCAGFMVEPAPVSPHLSREALARLKAFLVSTNRSRPR